MTLQPPERARWWAPAVPLAVLVAVMLATGPASATHPGPGDQDSLDHLDVYIEDVEPGGSHHVPIESVSHGPLREGWIYILHGLVQGNQSLDVTLQIENETIDEYVWQPGQSNTYSTKIQTTGYHDLLITNPSNQTVRYAFYYDQSCNCDSKWIPLQDGVVMFNYPLQEGVAVEIPYPLVKDWHVEAWLATHDDASPTAHWPDDFEILEEKQAQGPGPGEEGWGWLNFTVRPAYTGMHYVRIHALSPIAGPEQAIMLGATIEELDDANAEKEAPGPAMVPFLLFATALVACIARFKRTG